MKKIMTFFFLSVVWLARGTSRDIVRVTTPCAGLYDSYSREPCWSSQPLLYDDARCGTIRPMQRYQVRYPFSSLHDDNTCAHDNMPVPPHLWKYAFRVKPLIDEDGGDIDQLFYDAESEACEAWTENAQYATHFNDKVIKRTLYQECLQKIFVRVCDDLNITTEAFGDGVRLLGGEPAEVRDVLSASCLHLVRVLLSNPHDSLTSPQYYGSSVELVKGLRPQVKVVLLASSNMRTKLHHHIQTIVYTCDRYVTENHVVMQVLRVLGLVNGGDEGDVNGFATVHAGVSRVNHTIRTTSLDRISEMFKTCEKILLDSDATAETVTSPNLVNAYSDFIDEIFDLIPDQLYSIIVMTLEAKVRQAISTQMKWHERMILYWLFGY